MNLQHTNDTTVISHGDIRNAHKQYNKNKLNLILSLVKQNLVEVVLAKEKPQKKGEESRLIYLHKII